MTKQTGASANKTRPRLFVYSLGLVFQRRVHKILNAHGWSLKLGLPLSKNDRVAVWGRKGPAKRGMRVAQTFQKPLLTVEDAFLRSVLTGRQGAQSLGIVADWTGIYFDTDKPNDLGDILIKSQNITQKEQQLAADKMAYLRHMKLSKYNNFTPKSPKLADDYILVVDQTLNDAAILNGGADASSFVNMLASAKAEIPETNLYKNPPRNRCG